MKTFLLVLSVAVLVFSEEVRTDIDYSIVDSMQTSFLADKLFKNARESFFDSDVKNQVGFIKSLSSYVNDTTYVDNKLNDLYQIIKYERDYLRANMDSVELNDRQYFIGYLRMLQEKLRIIAISM